MTYSSYSYTQHQIFTFTAPVKSQLILL